MLDEMVGGWIAQRDFEAVMRDFEAAGAALAPIYDISQIVVDRQFAPIEDAISPVFVGVVARDHIAVAAAGDEDPNGITEFSIKLLDELFNCMPSWADLVVLLFRMALPISACS